LAESAYQSISALVNRIGKGDKRALDCLDSESRRLVENILRELHLYGYSRILDALWEQDFEIKPATIDQFINDEYYLGEIGADLFPRWKKELAVICNPKNEINEWVIRGAIGTGKCLARGTPVLMYDGSIKKVEDIVVGDQLMGDDSTPRQVLSLARGREMMYTVHQKNGDDYTVNESHILSLKLTPRKHGDDHVIHDVSVLDYLYSSQCRQNMLKGYKVAVDWEPKEVPLDPYFLGLWLGDGSISGGVSISVGDNDPEIRDYLDEFCTDNMYESTFYPDARGHRCGDYKVTKKWSGESLISVLSSLGLVEHHNGYSWTKRIPREYLVNNRDVRLSVLAGILDADAWYSSCGYYEIYAKSTDLANDIVFLARSLGFRVSIKDKFVNYTYNGVTEKRKYNRISISGDLWDIPVKIERKKVDLHDLSHNKDPRVCGITVEQVGEGDYFGFEIDGNHRFLLGDFTVTHNTFCAVFALLYRIHYLCCMKNPQHYYKMANHTPIVFGFFNIYKYLAQDTSYKYFTNWIKISPFFQDVMRKAYHDEKQIPGWLSKLNKMYGISNEDLAQSYVKFPKSITIALGSNAIHALGQNLFGGLMDEADMSKSKSLSSEDKTKVEELYTQAKSRIVSRFQQIGGVNPGLLILVSQVQDADSFLSKHQAKTEGNLKVHHTSFAIWEIKEDRFPPDEPKFKVAVGNRRIRSYIVDVDEQGNPVKPIPEELRVISVPESLRHLFEYSLDDAIRDQAGIPTYGVNLYLPRRDKLYDIYSKCKREHPFTCDEVVLSIEVNDDMSLVSVFDKQKCMINIDKSSGAWRPKWYAGVDRAIHVDLSKSKDCTGIAMGCIGDVKRIERYDTDGRPYSEIDVSIFIDFVVRVRAAKGSEIDYSKIRAFIYYLHRISYPVRWISFDAYQSTDSLQQLKKAGYEVKDLSVDKKPAPYYTLRNTIYEGRLDIYEYEPFTSEITKLQDNSHIKGVSPVVDHPPKGSKDCTDAVCGVATRLLEEKELFVTAVSNTDLDKKLGSFKQPSSSETLKAGKWVVENRSAVNPLEKLFRK